MKLIKFNKFSKRNPRLNRTFFYWQTSDVSPPLVTSCTKDPEAGRPSALEAQPCKRLATKSNPVQVDVSAFGIHFLFIGVSRVIGRRARVVAFSGNPDLGLPKLFVS